MTKARENHVSKIAESPIKTSSSQLAGNYWIKRVRRLALRRTALATASPNRIHLILLRIGAVVLRHTRRLVLPRPVDQQRGYGGGASKIHKTVPEPRIMGEMRTLEPQLPRSKLKSGRPLLALLMQYIGAR